MPSDLIALRAAAPRRRTLASGWRVAVLAAAVSGGCAKPVPNSPALNRPVEGASDLDNAWASTVLDASQRREVEKSFRSLPGDRTAGEVGPGPQPAPKGRWRDIPAAAGEAASTAEVAIVSTRFEPEGASLESAERIVFELVTLTSEPGRLEVSRGEAGRLYEAAATIGLFGERTETAKLLVEALASQVALFGRKPELAPLPK